jgi:diguanylate cyclase (GGDEF)-like protein
VGRGLRVGLIGGALVVSAASLTAGLLGVSRAQARQESAREAVDAVQLIDARTRLEAGYLDELNALTVGILTVPDPGALAAAHDRRITLEHEVGKTLETLSTRRNRAGAAAADLRNELGRLHLDEHSDAEALFNAAGTTRFASETPEEWSEIYPVSEAAIVTAMPPMVLHDLVGARYVDDHAVLAEPWPAFFESVDQYLRKAEPWFGGRADHPTADGRFEVSSAIATFPVEMAKVDGVLSGSPTWKVGQALVARQQNPGSPVTISLAEAAAGVADANRQLRPLVFDLLDRVRGEHEHTVAESTRLRTLWLALAIASAIALAGAIAVAVRFTVRAVRKSRVLVQRASIDELTGVGNRHHLAERTAMLAADQHFASHLIAMVDMNHFKMINDTWGHAAGDAVLKETARRLTITVNAICADSAGTQGTVVRVGGDEFLVSLHSRSALSSEVLRVRLLDAMAPLFDIGVAEMFPASASIGIAETDRAARLSDLMALADLAVYEDKAKRNNRPDVPAPASAPADSTA